MRTVPSPALVPPRPEARVFSLASPEFSTAGVLSGVASFISAAYHSANDPLTVPFVLPYGAVVSKFFLRTGSSFGGNFDIGIYDTAFARKVSTGSTAQTASNITQIVNVTDTALPPGRYHLAISVNNTTANRLATCGLVAGSPWRIAGCLDSATDAFPLPSTLTNMGIIATATRMPCMGFVTAGFGW